MMMLIQLFKNIIIDILSCFKYLRYMFYFIRFTLFNYSFILTFKTFISKIFYVYIVGFVYYLIYTIIFKTFDLFFIFNIINKLKKSPYFIYNETLDQLFYKINTQKKFQYYTINAYENIGHFFHRQFHTNKTSAYISLIYSRLTPEVFDLEVNKEIPTRNQYTSAHNIFNERYYQIYLYDKFFSLLIPCLINYIYYNLLNWKILYIKLKNKISFYTKYYYYLIFIKYNNNILFNIFHRLIYYFINLLMYIFTTLILSTIKFFIYISIIQNFILYNRFKFTTLFNIPRERLLVQSYLQGFQGNIYLESAAFITESIVYNVLNLFVRHNFIGYGTTKNYVSYHKHKFPILDYHIKDWPVNPKINYYNEYKEKKVNYTWKSLFNLPNRRKKIHKRDYLNIAYNNYLIKFLYFFKFYLLKEKFLFIYSFTNQLFVRITIFFIKFYSQIINKSIYIYKIQRFIDHFGWFSFILFLIITFDSFVYMYIYLL